MANFDYNRIVWGHSERALDGVNLVRRGLVSTATVYALPFGAIAPAGVKVTLGEGDPVNLFRAGRLLNPGAQMEPVPFGKHKRIYYGLVDGRR